MPKTKGFTIMGKARESGFTLIEILMVIAIIAALSAVVYAGFPAAQRKARDTQRKSDLSQYQTALGSYSNNNDGFFPVSDGKDLCDYCTDLGIESSHCPNDPKDEDTDCSYQYESNASGTEFLVWSEMENEDSFWVTCSNGLSGSVALAQIPPDDDGACPLTEDPSPPEPVCTVTDGGFEPYSKGTCDDGVNTYTDYCISATIIAEYNCSAEDNCILESFTCPDGCLDGACN